MAYDKKNKKSVLHDAIDKVKMVNAGIKGEDAYGPISPPKDMKNKILYPSLHLSGKEAPMLKGVNLGDEFQLVLDVRVKRCSSSTGISGNDYHSYDLDILKIGKSGE